MKIDKNNGTNIRPTVEEIMTEIRKTEHKIAFLHRLIGFVDLFEAFSGRPPERLIDIGRDKVPLDKDVIETVRTDIWTELRAEKARLAKMRGMKTAARIPARAGSGILKGEERPWNRY